MTFAILTNIGRSKEAASLATGAGLNITEMAWGDGDRVPAGGETALLAEKGRKGVTASGIDPNSQNTAFFEILLDENEGPFTIREMGLFDADGDMIAVARMDPPVNKPLTYTSALLRMHVLFSDLQNLVINVQSIGALVPADRKLTAGAGLKGGGDLSADRKFDVSFASVAEALAGSVSDKSISPATLGLLLNGLGGGAKEVNNLDAIGSTGLYTYGNAAVGNPLPNIRGSVLHIEAPLVARAWQLVIATQRGRVYSRYRSGDVWQPWDFFWCDSTSPYAFEAVGGYMKFANNFMIQWGESQITNADGTGNVINYPLTFPVRTLRVLANDRSASNSVGTQHCISIREDSATTHFTAVAFDTSGNWSTTGIRWLAIGV